ncbi:hypothetical protein NM3164_1850 [Neisseria meningitidis NM3164]|uniref:Uncharacterized protein conserved in bacteria n=3 Tax=Neisseria meningitidis TaxID=487 RepID=A0A2X1WB35_NEIME|nr:type II toxin-antitoxin system RelE/ParE family toxin [Neisseria meningitidis]EHP14224.1 hypothetical protein NMY220_1727 [Neisseria meningitidis NM220]EHP14505.1 hypothetical protein NMY233_1706 [Neisseria meningitidis NM233]EJU50907.1 hypothetical protein NMEN255_1799 [Neisseria meningitidis NM255]EJU56758.1 hypothetical protein NMEN140_1775 [Neisseria meningitidis NM140]EJU57090.1 hypothetical protein NMEN183_1786 [Neisseria meningitidis NM183]EJU62346.1 hypothetical protein NMEN2781_06
MRIFKNQWIVKFAKKHKINDSELLEAVERADNGLIDADLGGGVIKQRIARQGQGRSGGYRSLILFKQADRAFSFTPLPRTTGKTFRIKNWTFTEKPPHII